MKIKIIIIALLFCFSLLPSEIRVSSLKDIVTLCILGQGETYDTSRSFSDCNHLVSIIHNKSLQQKFFEGLVNNLHPEIMDKINSFMISFNKFNNQIATDQLSVLCKQYAKNEYLKTLQKTSEIPSETFWQKVLVKNINNDILILKKSISPDVMCDVMNRFCVTIYKNRLQGEKKILHTDLYKISNEVNLNPTHAYQGEPIGVKDKLSWVKNSQLTNKIDTFCADNSFILTYQSGELEWHKDNEIKHFAINNSISSVSCGFNKKIVLGSYDGTITMIDIAQSGAYSLKKRPFLSEPISFSVQPLPFEERVVKPLIKKIYKNINNFKITSVHYKELEKLIFYSQKNGLYSLDETADIATLILTCSSLIICTAIKNNLIACACADNTISLYDCHTKKMITIEHPASINTLCLYAGDDNQIYLMIGDQVGTLKGSVTINRIINDRYVFDMVTESILPQAAPVYSIEIASNNKEIIIKTTSFMKDGFGWKSFVWEDTPIGNTIISYPTPDNLEESHRVNLYYCSYIRFNLRKHRNNPYALYKMLCYYKSFLYTHKLNEDIVFLKKNVEDRIIKIIKSDNFKRSINSIDAVKNLLIKFSEMLCKWGQEEKYRFVKYIRDVNPLAEINKEIKIAIQDLCIDLFIDFYEKDKSDKMYRDIIKIVNDFQEIQRGKNWKVLESLLAQRSFIAAIIRGLWAPSRCDDDIKRLT